MAKAAGFTSKHIDAFCIRTSGDRVYILSRQKKGCDNGVAALCMRLGFRFYVTLPRWWITPQTKTLSFNLNFNDQPALIGRSFMNAMDYDDYHSSGQAYWGVAIRETFFRSDGGRPYTGAAYSNIIYMNKNVAAAGQAFKKHPEYFAMLPNGKRDTESSMSFRRVVRGRWMAVRPDAS